MKTKKGILFVTVIILSCVLLFAASAGEEVQEPFEPDEYTETERITAGLSIAGGTATCSGRVVPTDTQSCSLEMKLYKKNGNSWTTIHTWNTSATGGNYADLNCTISVNHGTYKVVCNGNVAGESSTASSNEVTW